MKILREKKLLLAIIFITILVIVLSSIVIINQYQIYQNKTNIVIANIIGEIKEKYPDIDEKEIISILNMNKD